MKAALQLGGGARVDIEGDPDDVRQLLALLEAMPRPRPSRAGPRQRRNQRRPLEAVRADAGTADISEIDVVNRMKDDDRSSSFNALIDQGSMLERVLLVLFVAGEMGLAGITSGFVSRVYDQLGVRLALPNVSRELATKARQYVLSDSTRKQGATVRYRLSRNGAKYVEGLL